MALLDNAYVKQSPQMMREYRPVAIQTSTTDLFDAQQHTIDIPCVRVEIPQRDWSRIVELIEAHERAVKNVAVQDAWDQYLMLTHLTKPYGDLKNR